MATPGRTAAAAPSAAAFFGSIGLKELSGRDLPGAIRRHGGASLLDRGLREYASPEASIERRCGFLYADLGLHKLLLGAELPRLRSDATLLESVSAPPSGGTVLDVGGGAGAVAYFLCARWPDVRFVVADPFGNACGVRWSRELGLAGRVAFIESGLPELTGAETSAFAVVLLTSTLAFVPGVGGGPDAGRAGEQAEALRRSARSLARVLAPGGTLVLVEQWDAPRLVVVARAFAEEGLGVSASESAVAGRPGDVGRLTLRAVEGAAAASVLPVVHGLARR